MENHYWWTHEIFYVDEMTSRQSRSPEAINYNLKRNKMLYHIKVESNEEQKQKLMNTYASMKLIYNLNQTFNKYCSIESVDDEEQKRELESVINRLRKLVEWKLTMCFFYPDENDIK